MLVQLIYISVIVGITIDQIENFVDNARIRNLAGGLAGLLLITDRHYIHYIEGEREAVSNKYYEVSHSTHQSKCTILRFNEIAKREFPEFAASYSKLSDFSKEEIAKIYPEGSIDIETMTSTAAMCLIRKVAAHHRADFKAQS